jgi:hypothetical protein
MVTDILLTKSKFLAKNLGLNTQVTCLDVESYSDASYHETVQIIKAQVQNLIAEATKTLHLSPYNPGSPLKSRRISNNQEQTKIDRFGTTQSQVTTFHRKLIHRST